MPTPPQFDLIDYYGGPLDGEVGAMSDGVRMVQQGGFYEAGYVNGHRKLVWHEVQGLTLPEGDG